MAESHLVAALEAVIAERDRELAAAKKIAAEWLTKAQDLNKEAERLREALVFIEHQVEGLDPDEGSVLFAVLERARQALYGAKP